MRIMKYPAFLKERKKKYGNFSLKEFNETIHFTEYCNETIIINEKVETMKYSLMEFGFKIMK